MKNKLNILIIVFTTLTLVVSAAPTNWTVNTSGYEYSLTLTATVQLEGGIDAAENDMVAAFVNNECRGVTTATYVDAYKKYYFFLTVFSNQYEGEEVELRFYQHASDSIYAAISSLTFTEGANLGSASEPFAIGNTELSYALEISNDTISENKAAGTFIGKLEAKENGAQYTATFALLNNKEAFIISTDSLFSATSFNYEEKASYTVKVLAYSSDSLKVCEDSLVIKINDVYEPFELGLSNNTIAENSGEDAFIGKLQATANSKTSFAFALDSVLDINAFYLKSDSLFAKQSLNFEEQNQYDIKVMAIALIDTIKQAFQINITDVNEAPSGLSLSNDTISENMPSGTFIGVLSAFDEDINDTVTFQQVIPTGEDFTYFNIRNDSVFTYDIFDFEDKQKHSLIILATDKLGLESEGFFEIVVNDKLEVSINYLDNSAFSIYPNPASHIIKLMGVDVFNKVEIYNVNGLLVETKENFDGNINIESLNNGIYFVKVFSQTKIGVKSFVKR